jgi:hypothetical protein
MDIVLLSEVHSDPVVAFAYKYLFNGLDLSPSASGGSKLQNGGSQHETPELAFIAASECRRA